MTCPPDDNACRPVGRPREFDEGEVLDRAMEAFWRSGFQATSVCDLVNATGLQKGSLYKAFGDKHGLFIAALDRYLAGGHEKVRAALGDDLPARDAIGRWFGMLSGTCGAAGGRRGCMALNVAVELGPGDEVVRERLERHFGELETLLSQTIERGRSDGSIDDGVDAPAAAAFLVVFVNGLMAGGRGDQPAARAQRAMDQAFRILDPVGAPG